MAGLITVVVPKNRWNLAGVVVWWEYVGICYKGDVCCCKADNAQAKKKGNPTRDPLHRWGDFPTGQYRMRVLGVRAPVRTYGQTPVIELIPVRGPCKTAELNGRTGLWMHEGALNSKGLPRPTFGCIRTRKEMQETCVWAIERMGVTELIARAI
jgi:hypothetical protein